MMLLMLIKNDAACFTQFLMITNDDKNVANEDVEVEMVVLLPKILLNVIMLIIIKLKIML